ncbi:MAG: UDP-N-acetylglucosamine diphosphorylase [Candidatus Glassbacteria bacterium]|nr:UDP-N-acetylglucosamine diphosphorylase [Candidatus Glassbacteria bacterium]
MFAPTDFFDLDKAPFPGIYRGIEYVWEAIPRIAETIEQNLVPGVHRDAEVSPGAFVGEKVQIGPGTVLEHGAVILGPAIIGAGCQVRSGAYIRQNVIVGEGSVVGNSCECKNCILHSSANVPHFAYVGDSLLGYKAHLGAGVKISNVKLTWTNVTVKGPEGPIDTGLVKFGAVLGDYTDIGCNSVLNPGTVIGPHSIVYPNSSWRGVLPPKHIAKLRQSFETVERKD